MTQNNMRIFQKSTDKKRGIITTYVLIFGTVFLIMLGGILGFAFYQMRLANEKMAWNEALHIAEAGINYYRWCITNEVEGSCTGQKEYFDAQGNSVGSFLIEAIPTISCGQTIRRKIISEGWTNESPNVKRKISVIYARESVAQYSYVLNDNVWVGADHEIRGPYHSNGGIRMDGENQSLVSSGRDEWVCTSSFGCSSCPASAGCHTSGGKCYCPGVFTTANGDEGLFEYPITPFDFVGITVDLAGMKNLAGQFGVYLASSTSIDANAKGYHVVFLNNGSFEVRIITGLSSTEAYSLEEDWHDDYFTITSEYLYNTYFIPSECSAIFIEDNVWPEGEVKGKVTLASANLSDPNVDTDMVLLGNINYTSLDGSDGLALISERNILIGPQSPDKMEIRGIFIAQKGRFSRNHYPNNFREKLEIYGSVVSNGRVGTQWTSGSSVVSGYLQRESYFDTEMIYGAPAFVPYINPDFKILDWQELD